MDSVTQIVLGAAVGEAVAGRQSGKKAIAYGALAGLLPDLDVLLAPMHHPTHQLLVHRGVTHSLFFAVALSPLLAMGVKKLHRTDPSSGTRWGVLFFLALLTHSLLDVMTIYGTGFFEPFSPIRLGIGAISIVDPLYTLPMLLTLIISLVRYQKRWAHRMVLAGLVASHLYLAGAGVNKFIVGRHFEAELARQHIAYSELMTCPGFLNTVLWYGVARAPDGIWLGFHSHLDKDPGIRFRYFAGNYHLEKNVDPEALGHLTTFSKGWHVLSQKDGVILYHDLRFGTLDGTVPVFSYDFRTPDKRPFGVQGESADFDRYMRRVTGEKFP